MKTVFLKSVLFIFVLCFLHGPASTAETDSSMRLIGQVKSIVQQRLSLMPAVARYKWDRNLPVEDLAREAQILDRTVRQATNMGLHQMYAQQAVTAQMTAAKMIQSRLFQTWGMNRASVNDVQPQDLVKDIRPKISKLTNQLITMLVQLRAVATTCSEINALTTAPANSLFTAQEWHVAIIGVIPNGLACDK